MIWALLVIIMLETVAIAIMSHYTYKMALAMLRVQDAVEESLDVLDKRYESISKILKIRSALMLMTWKIDWQSNGKKCNALKNYKQRLVISKFIN